MTRFLHLGPDAVHGDRVTFETAAAHHWARWGGVGDVVQAWDTGRALSVRIPQSRPAARGADRERVPLAKECR